MGEDKNKKTQAILQQLMDTIADEVVAGTTELVIKEKVSSTAGKIAGLRKIDGKGTIAQLSLQHSKKVLPSCEELLFCEHAVTAK